MNEIENLGYCNKALNLKKDIEGYFLTLGEYLYNIKEYNLFEPQWSSWIEFTYELKMSSSNINTLINIYKTLILGYGLKNEMIATAGGYSLVAEILPMATSKKDAEKWLEIVNTSTRSDLRKTIKELKSGIIMSECEHKETYQISICKTCGERWEIYET